MIKKNDAQIEQIIEATCDCCGQNIPIKFGQISDHLRIGGYSEGKLLDAIVCINCMNEKLSFINIQKKNNTLGYC